ncbi:MAG: DUF3500 domain-containing protein [Planctomycetes bacterium]|nr:DUF3500 domain-containing protein [Planctomycetota bacterium]
MDRNQSKENCPDCEGLDRRDFMAVAGTALAASSLPLIATSSASAAPTKKSAAESAAGRLFDSLTDDQKKVVALPFSDPRRHKISANWKVTAASIGQFFSADQQEIIKEIVQGVTSGDGFERFMRQMKADAGGFEKYSIALFGNPKEDKFEFELTGRHLTLRADGNCVPGAAFGGPIVYGHGASGNSKGNLFAYQTNRANEVFKALDGKQREKALLKKAPKESAVQLRDDVDALPGIACSELMKDQKELVAATLRDILKPYREEDVDEVMEIVKAGGGMDKVHIAFYESGDLDNDKVWDVWRLESPNLVCHFRGAPHVHAYINVAKRA